MNEKSVIISSNIGTSLFTVVSVKLSIKFVSVKFDDGDVTKLSANHLLSINCCVVAVAAVVGVLKICKQKPELNLNLNLPKNFIKLFFFRDEAYNDDDDVGETFNVVYILMK